MDFDKNLPRKMVAEFLGTMGLIIAVIGSVMLVNFTFGDHGTILNAVVQGAAAALILFAMLEALGKISGGHFNPAVTVAMLVSKEIDAKNSMFYIVAQILGAVVGVVLLNLTFFDFTDAIFFVNDTATKSVYLVISEFLCTFLLVVVVLGCVRSGSKKTSLAVGALVGGMIMATASTFYANPAVDIARIFTNADCGINPVTAVYYIIAAILGAIVAAALYMWLYPKEEAQNN